MCIQALVTNRFRAYYLVLQTATWNTNLERALNRGQLKRIRVRRKEEYIMWLLINLNKKFGLCRRYSSTFEEFFSELLLFDSYKQIRYFGFQITDANLKLSLTDELYKIKYVFTFLTYLHCKNNILTFYIL